MSAISGTIARFQSLADGTIRYLIDVSPADDRHEFHAPHATVALALLTGPGASAVQPPPATPSGNATTSSASSPGPSPYGQAAKALRLSGFCRAPKVWERLGEDWAFLEWVRTQPCLAPSMLQGKCTPCHGDVVAAHVRRIANGAGTGIKPPWSAIPLCARHHHDQHQHGESVLGGKDLWDQMRIHTVEAWAWQRLRTLMGYESLAQCPPEKLAEWASNNGLAQYLPAEYRAAIP